MTKKNDGLYEKYYVQKIVGNDLLEVHDWVFVLNPLTDPGAVEALWAYIGWCDDNEYYKLAQELTAKLAAVSN